MYQATIQIDSVEDAREFASVCGEQEFTVELLSGEYVVSAKSIMGLLSLELAKPVCMRADCDPGHAFVQMIRRYIKEN